jgi:chromosome transmission fidelity protein 1
MLRQRKEMETRLAKVRAKEKAQRERYLRSDQRHKKRKVDRTKKVGDDHDEEQFVLDDYDSGREQTGPSTVRSDTGLSAATVELLGKLGMNLDASKEEEVDGEDEIKAC